MIGNKLHILIKTINNTSDTAKNRLGGEGVHQPQKPKIQHVTENNNKVQTESYTAVLKQLPKNSSLPQNHQTSQEIAATQLLTMCEIDRGPNKFDVLVHNEAIETDLLHTS